MTQQYMGQIPDPSQESGNDLAARLNGFDNGHRTNQSGSTRPAGILAGGIWTRVAGGVYDLMLFDGTQDRVVMRGDRNLAGLTDVEAARTNLGLGGLAVKNKVAIIGDTSGTLSVARGGTGATDAGGARTALGLAYATKVEAETGAANNRVMTPLRTAQAITELVVPFGEGQEWVDVTASRSSGTAYQNTTGRTISVSIRSRAGSMQTSFDGSTWLLIGLGVTDGRQNQVLIIPSGHYYRLNGGALEAWAELR